MSRILTVQMSAYTDNLWGAESGEIAEGTRLPYPYYVNEAGEVQRQDFWNGTVAAVIGFTREPDRRAIDLYWADAWREPDRAIGMYIVTRNAAGQWATWPVAVQSMEEVAE